MFKIRIEMPERKTTTEAGSIVEGVKAVTMARLITTVGGADRHKMRASSPGSEMR